MNGAGCAGSPSTTASLAPFGRNGGASIQFTAATGVTMCGDDTGAGAFGAAASSMTFHAPFTFFHVVTKLPRSVTGFPDALCIDIE